MRAQLRLYCRNETLYWPHNVRRQAGHGIFRTYLYDALRKGHCRETTLSYQLWPLYTSFFRHTSVFDLPERPLLLENNDPIYVYCWRLERLASTSFYEYGDFTYDTAEEYESKFLDAGRECMESRPLVLPANIKIPSIEYEFSPLWLEHGDLTTEQWVVEFRFNGVSARTLTRPLDPYQRDAGLAQVEEWIFQTCARNQYTSAEIRLERPAHQATNKHALGTITPQGA